MKSTNKVSQQSSYSAKEEKKTEWTSIYLGSFLTFMAAAQFTLYFSSLFPYMKLLDKSTTETFFGLVISSYSLSQSIASPILGWWSNRIKRLKPALFICTFFMFAGNSLYFFVKLVPFHPKYVLMLARFIAGFGDSCIGLLKAYAAAASAPKDRSRAIAFVTGGMALGTIFGPAFQLLFSWFGYPGLQVNSRFSVSMFNSPALFACATNILSFILLLTLFKESFVGVDDIEMSKESDSKCLPPYDRIAALICYCLRFTQIFVITNLETIGASFSIIMFSWTATEVVFYGSLAHVCMGVLSFAIYAFYIVTNAGRKVNERLVCLSALIGFLAFHIFTFSWPFLKEDVITYSSEIGGNATSATGCNLRESPWCDHLKKVNVFVYYLLFIFSVGFAFPNINVTMNTLFSRIIGPRLQGTQQGILQMSGGAARMVGPILVGFFYTNYGPRMVWMLESGVITVMIIIWTVSYKRLVPLKYVNDTTSSITISIASSTALEEKTFKSLEINHDDWSNCQRITEKL